MKISFARMAAFFAVGTLANSAFAETSSPQSLAQRPGPGGRRAPVVLAASQVTFDYSSQDGEFRLECEHELPDPELKDFKVVCGKGTVHERRFVVHLMAHRYLREQAPVMTAYEIIYSVMHETAPQAQRFTSNSMWLTLKGDAPLVDVTLSQSVENDYAYLTLKIGAR